tara:strand:+ start:17677 stop:17937 length:261 start_codon:yes stop_codon:yes gene_type:complete
MPEVHCPSCNETIGVESSGIYECPYCEEEFIWQNKGHYEEVPKEYIGQFSPMPIEFKIIFGAFGILFLMLLLGFLFIAGFSGVWGT